MTNREYLIKLLAAHDDEELSEFYLTCLACSYGKDASCNSKCEKGMKKWLDSKREQEK